MDNKGKMESNTLRRSCFEEMGIWDVTKELPDWLTQLHNSTIHANIKTKTRSLFSEIQRCNEIGTKFRSHQFVASFAHVAAQPTDRSQLLNALYTKFPSHQSVTILVARFDGSNCK